MMLQYCPLPPPNQWCCNNGTSHSLTNGYAMMLPASTWPMMVQYCRVINWSQFTRLQSYRISGSSSFSGDIAAVIWPGIINALGLFSGLDRPQEKEQTSDGISFGSKPRNSIGFDERFGWSNQYIAWFDLSGIRLCMYTQNQLVQRYVKLVQRFVPMRVYPVQPSDIRELVSKGSIRC